MPTVQSHSLKPRQIYHAQVPDSQGAIPQQAATMRNSWASPQERAANVIRLVAASGCRSWTTPQALHDQLRSLVGETCFARGKPTNPRGLSERRSSVGSCSAETRNLPSRRMRHAIWYVSPLAFDHAVSFISANADSLVSAPFRSVAIGLFGALGTCARPTLTGNRALQRSPV
jgi:hypothetical protein